MATLARALAPLALLAAASLAAADGIDISECEVAALTEAGWVCGEKRSAGVEYASFLGVPYAKQPLRELRFQELQPLEPWSTVLKATSEGPMCPQTDLLYTKLVGEPEQAEACIHANIHVPLRALPARDQPVQPADQPADQPGLPILVFVHGGGFAFGSGTTELHGPEYLISQGVIVITFNYRLNVFGFLSLNSSFVPGNAGVRDAVTLLRWVRRNARGFGGDPARVTLAGQSAGAAIAHLLTLVPQARGLFQRVICMSGVATSDFFSSSPLFAATVGQQLLQRLKIDPSWAAEKVHQRLVDEPLENIMRANQELLDMYGLTTFVPVVESLHPGVEPILSEDPEELLARGAGADIPMMLGFTDAECETFRPRFEEFHIAEKINATPIFLLSPRLTFSASPASIPQLISAVSARYLRGDAGAAFVRFCSDAYYRYPAMRVAAQRAGAGNAPLYMYRFSYTGQRSAIKQALGLKFEGAGHIEDLTYVFRPNGFFSGPADGPVGDDHRVVELMTKFVVNFTYSEPRSPWTPAGSRLRYLSIPCAPAPHARPRAAPCMRDPSPAELDTKRFFDSLYHAARDTPTV